MRKREMKLLTKRQLKSMNICSDCKKFINKFKKWNENKIPKVVIIDNYECKKCKLFFDVYKDMCCVWRIINQLDKEWICS